MRGTAVVTGAFSYTGRAAARSLLARGWRVRTLTGRATPIRPFDGADALERAPLQFGDSDRARWRSCGGADVLVNRDRYPGTRTAACASTTRWGTAPCCWRRRPRPAWGRVVHLSVANPSADDQLDYYRGKARVEAWVARIAGPDAIVRPTLVAGFRRHPGSTDIARACAGSPFSARRRCRGVYRVQSVLLDDLGEIVADAAQARGNATLDVAGARTR